MSISYILINEYILVQTTLHKIIFIIYHIYWIHNIFLCRPPCTIIYFGYLTYYCADHPAQLRAPLCTLPCAKHPQEAWRGEVFSITLITITQYPHFLIIIIIIAMVAITIIIRWSAP